MSRRQLLLASVCAGVLAAAAPLAAQSMPATSRAKDAARRAVAATNAQIQAEQNVDAPAPAKPAARAPIPTASTHVAEASHPVSGDAKPGNAERPNAKMAKPGSAQPASAGAAAKGAPKSAAASSAARHAVAAHGARSRDTVAVAGPQGTGVEGSTSIAERGGKNELSLLRETFTYDPGGRRDPFVSLIESGELRPMVSDLRLTAVVFDPGGRSVAVLRDVSTKEQYRIRAGETLGRMRVARIDPKSVTFTLEEFGYSRQETLALNDSTRAR